MSRPGAGSVSSSPAGRITRHFQIRARIDARMLHDVPGLSDRERRLVATEAPHSHWHIGGLAASGLVVRAVLLPCAWAIPRERGIDACLHCGWFGIGSGDDRTRGNE